MAVHGERTACFRSMRSLSVPPQRVACRRSCGLSTAQLAHVAIGACEDSQNLKNDHMTTMMSFPSVATPQGACFVSRFCRGTARATLASFVPFRPITKRTECTGPGQVWKNVKAIRTQPNPKQEISALQGTRSAAKCVEIRCPIRAALNSNPGACSDDRAIERALTRQAR